MAAATPVLSTEQPARKASLPPSARKTAFRWGVPIALGVLIRIAPTPAGLSVNAWHYFALFAAVIAALITEPLPGAAVGLIGVSIATISMFVGKTPAEAVKWALSGFSNDTVWLAISVISLMLLTKVITWNDIAANKQAWGVLVWFATLVAMADALNTVGFLKSLVTPITDPHSKHD
jgi:di/tricarboxylate transporter